VKKLILLTVLSFSVIVAGCSSPKKEAEKKVQEATDYLEAYNQYAQALDELEKSASNNQERNSKENTSKETEAYNYEPSTEETTKYNETEYTYEKVYIFENKAIYKVKSPLKETRDIYINVDIYDENNNKIDNTLINIGGLTKDETRHFYIETDKGNIDHIEFRTKTETRYKTSNKSYDCSKDITLDEGPLLNLLTAKFYNYSKNILLGNIMIVYFNNDEVIGIDRSVCIGFSESNVSIGLNYVEGYNRYEIYADLYEAGE